MTEEEQRQEVAVWGENMNLMKDCSLEKTDEDMYYNSEWDYTCEESELVKRVNWNRKTRMTLMYIRYMKQECIIFIRIDFKKI
jgi:hypothetical protein